MKKNEELAVGDYVKLITDQYGDYTSNPVWGGVHGHIYGVVESVDSASVIVHVQWMNGYSNIYTRHDLKIVSPTEAAEPTLLNGLEKVQVLKYLL